MISKALIIAAGFVGVGLSQDGGHILTDLPETSADVIVAGVIPKASEGTLQLNEVLDAVVGIVNEGSEAINVTSIAGSLTSPYDSNYYYQNVR